MCQVFSSFNSNKEFTNIHQRDEYDAGYRIFQELGNAVNSGNSLLVEGCLDAFIREHRTLQQDIVRLFYYTFSLWIKGDKSMLVDGRNEGAWLFAELLSGLDIHLPRV